MEVLASGDTVHYKGIYVLDPATGQHADFSPIEILTFPDGTSDSLTAESATSGGGRGIALDADGHILSSHYKTLYKINYMTGEGVAMLAEGIKPALIENAGKMTGMPMAPLALSDAVALDLAWKVTTQTKKDFEAEGKEFPITPMYSIMEEMVEKQGRFGKKNNKGFYEYPENGKKYLWPELSNLCKESDDQPDVEELKKRFLYIQALETAKCYEENVLTDVRDADIGAILGWGMAPWTGGPLSFIDMVGVKEFVAEADKLAQKYGERFTPCKMLRDMAAKNESFHKSGSSSQAA